MSFNAVPKVTPKIISLKQTKGQTYRHCFTLGQKQFVLFCNHIKLFVKSKTKFLIPETKTTIILSFYFKSLLLMIIKQQS